MKTYLSKGSLANVAYGIRHTYICVYIYECIYLYIYVYIETNIYTHPFMTTYVYIIYMIKIERCMLE